MTNHNVEKLADMLVNYSVEVKPGDNVYIAYSGDETRPLLRELIAQVYKAGGRPFLHRSDPWAERALVLHAGEEQLKLMADSAIELMKHMDCYIGFRAVSNSAEMTGVPADQMRLWNSSYIMPVAMERCSNTRWVVLNYPTAAAAQAMNMNTEDFEDFYYQVNTMDYRAMNEAMKPLAELMDRTDRVHITGPGTDLTFSIKGIGTEICAGKSNVPDGEIYTAPVLNSVNGTVTYNATAPYAGFLFENICFRFENGRIVEATANDSERLNGILDTDARYVGEFAIGVNPYITRPMRDTLFDEKNTGSFHFTSGMSYDTAGNGNKSLIHWDLVCIQTPEYGGGEIWFDDVLIRKDGLFVLPELLALNPENLK